jgi:hypothetical protein
VETRDLSPEEWLGREDRAGQEARLSRLRWLAAQYPRIDYQLFPGGAMSRYLFDEARYCFAYGQFLATVMLGLALVEQSLAAQFFMTGRDDLERASLSKLLDLALGEGWMSHDEHGEIQRARRNRNTVAHFRRPLHRDTLERRSISRHELPYILMEQDARSVLKVVFQLIDRWPLSV